jgi:2-polyprenyl-3-methyl-5-hydroxy-6-metoxy-1,4-benzoquinol methylase
MNLIPDASYYDEVAQRWGYHYTQHKKWFGLMLLVADRIKKDGIVDLGCGAGHMAELLYDWGYWDYTGLDFSEGMLQVARKRDLNMEFKNVDFEEQLWVAHVGDFNTVIALELLEHLPSDLALIEQIPEGKHVIMTTTNEPGREHVRHFTSEYAVKKRYGKFFSTFEVLSFKNMYLPSTIGWQVFYIIDGIRGKS